MKTVFITGASSGLGKSMAYEFASRGYQLAIAARRPLQEMAEDIASKHGVKVQAYELDVTDYAAVATCLQEVKKEFSTLDIVIANAGMGVVSLAGKDASFAGVKNTMETNVLGLMATVEHALPILREQGFGQIVGLSSVAGERGLPRMSSYCASKSAVTTYLRTVQLETRNENIDVTILKPGYIDTPINQGSKSRPFVIPLEQGGKKLVDRIEQRVKSAFVPSWPWALIGRVVRILPDRLLA